MDKTNKVPLYLQLMKELVHQIQEGIYSENDKLPSEREFCDIYHLSRITVRQALQELEREGFIYKLHGKGTFVAPKSYNQKLVKLYSFTEEMIKLGKQPATEVLSFTKIAIDERLARKMALEALDEVYQITRLRSADAEPLMYEVSYLPRKIFPDLTREHLERSPMYQVFTDKYDIDITRATERFSATTVRNGEENYLNVSIDHPAMLVKRFAYNQDQLVEYTISVARGDKFSYTVELT